LKDKPAVVYWLQNKLYLNVTNQCTNNCWFCIRNYKQGVGGFNLKLSEEPSGEEIINELESLIPSRRWKEVVFCGFGEPTCRLDVLLETVKWINNRYPNLPIRLDTNGQAYIINSGRDVANELKKAGISRVSISLNGHDERTYMDNCKPVSKGAFEAILHFTRKAIAVGFEIEVSAIRMPEVDIEKVKAIAESLGGTFCVRNYVPCFY
jgi:cyclic pyranopterin phosphate synthase